MESLTVKKRYTDDDGQPVEFEITLKEFPSDLNEAVDKFGAECVYMCFKQKYVVHIQAQMARLHRAGYDVADIEAQLQDFRPGSTARAVDPMKKVKAMVRGLLEKKIPEDVILSAGVSRTVLEEVKAELAG